LDVAGLAGRTERLDNPALDGRGARAGHDGGNACTAENRRSLFGGGRYDELLALFGNEKVAAFGFGMGDVTIRDTLQTYNLLPEVKGGADIYVAVLDEKAFGYAQDIAQKLREDGKKVALDYSLKKVGDQIKTALKLHIPKLIVIGETEMNKGAYEIRDLNA
jgi:histidyl-tRNA synthetase